MTEQNAKGVRGFILWNPFTNERFFRIYGEYDPVTKRKSFKDYDITIEDLEVEIVSGSAALKEYEDGRKHLGWSSAALGKKSP